MIYDFKAMRKHLILAATALVLAACGNDENIDNNGPVELRLSSGIEVQTRAAHNLDTQLKNGESVHVWVDDAGTDAGLYQDNTLTAGNNGVLTGGETMYFPASGNAADIYAIHGNFLTDLTSFWGESVTHEVATNQKSEGGNYAASDLVYCKMEEVARTTSTVQLNFKHLLSKVEIVLVQGAGAPEITSAAILNTKLQAIFTPAKANETITVTAAGEVTDSNPIEIDCGITDEATAQADSDEGKVLNEAIIVPQTLAANTPFIRVTTSDGGQLIYSLPAETTFDLGKRYRYTVTANLTGLNVTASIDDWGDGSLNNEGDAVMQ